MMPNCMIPFSMTSLPCLLHCMSIWNMFVFIIMFVHCIVPVTCFAYIVLTVTPFGVCFICNLISFSCTLCLCYCFMLLTNLKYGFGKNSTKCFNHHAALSVMPCLGCASLKLTSIDSFLYDSPFGMIVCHAMLA